MTRLGPALGGVATAAFGGRGVGVTFGDGETGTAGGVKTGGGVACGISASASSASPPCRVAALVMLPVITAPPLTSRGSARAPAPTPGVPSPLLVLTPVGAA